MTAASRRITLITLDAATLDSARDLGINVSTVADTALQCAVADARRRQWLDENAKAFAEQSAWHERNGHPLADIIVSPGGATWKS